MRADDRGDRGDRAVRRNSVFAGISSAPYDSFTRSGNDDSLKGSLASRLCRIIPSSSPHSALHSARLFIAPRCCLVFLSLQAFFLFAARANALLSSGSCPCSYRETLDRLVRCSRHQHCDHIQGKHTATYWSERRRAPYTVLLHNRC